MTEFDNRPTISPEIKTAVINGKEIRYLENQGIYSTHYPLVMIPGWPVSAVSLKPLMEELGDQFKSYAVNLPGFGGSETDYGTRHTFSHYAEFLDQFREIVGSEKINLLGYSTGGVLGIMYDNNFQDNLDKLILFAPPYNGIEHYKLTSEKDIRFLHLFSVLRRKRARALTFPLNKKLVKDWMIKTVINDTYKERYPEWFKEDGDFIKELIEETSLLDFKAIVDFADDLSKNDFSDEAGKVIAQTLVIAAENDEAVAPYRVRQLSRLIDGSQYELIPDADHAVGIFEPKEMAPLIVEFLHKQD